MNHIDNQVTALCLVLDERDRQNDKWGLQTHHPMKWLAILGEEYGEACEAALDAERDSNQLEHFRTEVIHVAAVALQILEDLERDTPYASNATLREHPALAQVLSVAEHVDGV